MVTPTCYNCSLHASVAYLHEDAINADRHTGACYCRYEVTQAPTCHSPALQCIFCISVAVGL